jgi:hypothetical protein
LSFNPAGQLPFLVPVRALRPPFPLSSPSRRFRASPPCSPHFRWYLCTWSALIGPCRRVGLFNFSGLASAPTPSFNHHASASSYLIDDQSNVVGPTMLSLALRGHSLSASLSATTSITLQELCNHRSNTQVVARIRNKQNLFKSKARKMGRNFVWKARYARPLGTCARRLIVQGKQGEKNGRYSPRATVPE